MISEFVPNNEPIYQSENARIYQCPLCLRAIFSQYEGDESPLIQCARTGHLLAWQGDRVAADLDEASRLDSPKD